MALIIPEITKARFIPYKVVSTSEGFLLSPGIKVKTGNFEVSSFYSYSRMI